jgi:hypothetical protein
MEMEAERGEIYTRHIFRGNAYIASLHFPSTTFKVSPGGPAWSAKDGRFAPSEEGHGQSRRLPSLPQDGIKTLSIQDTFTTFDQRRWRWRRRRWMAGMGERLL